jgi:hypothetical protein
VDRTKIDLSQFRKGTKKKGIHKNKKNNNVAINLEAQPSECFFLVHREQVTSL